MLFAGWEVRIVKNCDRGLEVSRLARRETRGGNLLLSGTVTHNRVQDLENCCLVLLL